MKAWLVLQEGPDAGRTYLLDPSAQSRLSVGRSSECHIVLKDRRASRHHADIRWDGRNHAWAVMDQGSTNHTHVNGMEVHGPYSLRLGDRVTIGETTMVLRPFSTQASASVVTGRPAASSAHPTRERGPTAEMQQMQSRAPGVQPRQAGRGQVSTARPSSARTLPETRGWAGWTVAFWIVQGIVAAAVVFLASGAFLPWVRVTGTLSQEVSPLVRDVIGIVSGLLGSDSSQLFTTELGGLDWYGKLTLGIAVVSLAFLIVDMFFYRKWSVPGIVYLLVGLIAIGTVAYDVYNLYQLYSQARALSLLFDISLAKIFDGIDYLIDIEPAILTGMWLTIIGLLLLVVGGIGRLALAFLDRQQMRSRP